MINVLSKLLEKILKTNPTNSTSNYKHISWTHKELEQLFIVDMNPAIAIYLQMRK